MQTHLDGPTSERVQNNAAAAAFNLPHMKTVFTSVTKAGQLPELVIAPTLASQSPEWPAVEATTARLHELFPKSTFVTTASGVTKALEGRPAEAIPFFELTVQQAPKAISAWNNLSRGYVAAGRDADAERACHRSPALGAQHIPTLEQLADIQWRQKDYPAAHETYGKLCVAVPENREFAQRAAESGQHAAEQ